MPAEIWEFADARHRSVELAGLAVEALDGPVGTVRRTVRAPEASFLAVDRAGREPLVVPAGLVERVDERRVYLDRTLDELEAAPAIDADAEPSRAEVLRLAEHYGTRSPRSLGVGLRKVLRLPS